MPKLKTRKSLAKRVKVTKRKKVTCFKGGRRHLLSAKSRKRKRNLGKRGRIHSGERKTMKRALPYAF